MAVVTLNDLPPVLGLNGTELLFLYQFFAPTQTWITYSCTSSQIADLLNGGTETAPSMRQLIAALSSQNMLVLVSEAVPGDITNSTNIAWNHAYRMTISDPFVTGFLQPTLGYTDAEMIALFALAFTFPV